LHEIMILELTLVLYCCHAVVLGYSQKIMIQHGRLAAARSQRAKRGAAARPPLRMILLGKRWILIALQAP